MSFINIKHAPGFIYTLNIYMIPVYNGLLCCTCVKWPVGWDTKWQT